VTISDIGGAVSSGDPSTARVVETTWGGTLRWILHRRASGRPRRSSDGHENSHDRVPRAQEGEAGV